MASYKAPLRDMRFVLYELMGGDALSSLPGYEEFTRDLIDPVLEEAAKICEQVLHPLNRSGDEEGCTLENGVVRTPSGFIDAYRTFSQGGWTAIACDPAYGGQGLPKAVNTLVEEMICSANLSFGMYPGLSHGAYVSLHGFGSDELKNAYLPKMVDGTWSGTMCLTEPHCGTDLGLLRTKALPQDDGSYRLSGTKIFISAGEHDLTENIIHLVLARLPDAPAGVKGISLFLVPKFLPDAAGNPGERNGVSCGSIEHKMGIKASSTCVMNFDDATGWLIGSANKGMAAMFAMMNTERLSVGIQGLGLAEASYQGAVAYARERLQGRSLSGAKHPDKPADPIIVHPDVRRMLLTQRAYVEGCRALGAWAAHSLDIKNHHPDAKTRQDADDFVALITPVIKALMTDLGFEAANMGMQVLGGHGFIREHGMEQYVRDCRISQIYEGTNGIQALDLVGRKMPAHAGRYLRGFFHPVQAFIEANMEDEALGEFVQPLAKAFVRLQQATGQIARTGMAKPDEAGAAATDYLRLFGLTALAYMWARMVQTSLDKVDGDDGAFYRAKIGTARFYMERLLPQTSGLFSAIMAGGASMMDFAEDAF
ncbi:acyl-CoA dehydrogenase C-terminal domain-containing protein [Magnetospirillum sulfuroxidans]|uniref:Acyl-CoA dehydrogenase C-terminal domain-containing protein n=1 Tax=Magnetospirillum sulfuroxidans TaxID=611300 RepID=A0ABS5IHE6_9PROT|nr:acyl-CoA dehydrogenase C-terminal domain-containing protein [Magnetospirillum sulfuroxidans]MBR9973824.1 acyl-CoA dehydrogenase C-terminal domain-containing protein [Magnetospirillum sulfuroxidans]